MYAGVVLHVLELRAAAETEGEKLERDEKQKAALTWGDLRQKGRTCQQGFVFVFHLGGMPRCVSRRRANTCGVSAGS